MGWLLIKKHRDVIESGMFLCTQLFNMMYFDLFHLNRFILLTISITMTIITYFILCIEGKQLNYDDLIDDWTVMFQKNLDPWFTLFMCFVFPGLVCLSWGDSFWHGYWVAGALRYVLVLYATWCVNSAAHLYGDHPYDFQLWPAENPFVSYVAVGEGWHNWHHKYPYDYAASEYGIHRQFNPTKLFIDIMVLLGLASDCKRATGAWTQVKAKRDAAALASANVASAMSQDKKKAN
jgi:stearoyl-CoA desaturase (delta-9 desaturase)